jgi:hypothetical protein
MQEPAFLQRQQVADLGLTEPHPPKFLELLWCKIARSHPLLQQLRVQLAQVDLPEHLAKPQNGLLSSGKPTGHKILKLINSMCSSIMQQRPQQLRLLLPDDKLVTRKLCIEKLAEHF